MSPSVVIVDDHPLVGVALCLGLRELGVDAIHLDVVPPDPRMVVGDGPGLLVVDLELGEGAPTAGQIIEEACRRGWTAVLLTGSTNRAEIAAAVAAGALGRLEKSTAFDRLVATIAAAARGELVLDPAQRKALVAEHLAARRASSDLDRRWNRLTPREREILACLVNGKRVADVAREHVVSPATVRTQVRSILGKLEVSSQLEAVALARKES